MRPQYSLRREQPHFGQCDRSTTTTSTAFLLPLGRPARFAVITFSPDRYPPAMPGACYRYTTCFRFRLTFFGVAPRKSETPSIEAAAAQPTRQSRQWLSTALALSFHSLTVRLRASVRTRYLGAGAGRGGGGV